MPCKGLCENYRAKKDYRLPRYANGQKRCQICQIFIRYFGTRCPCCGYRLRVSPRGSKSRAKLRKSKTRSASGILVSIMEDARSKEE